MLAWSLLLIIQFVLIVSVLDNIFFIKLLIYEYVIFCFIQKSFKLV